MKLFPGGDRVFEAISRYDDLVTLEGRPDYEPGDTLALIVPFLLLHGVTEADITALAARATLTGGADRLVSHLQGSGWRVFCITTTYEQYASYITHKLGIYAPDVACTRFPLDKFRTSLGWAETTLLKEAEAEILAMSVDDDRRLKQGLDSFFLERLPSTEAGAALGQVKPVGGRRKAVALNRFAGDCNQPLSRWVVVGDSITDFRMFQAVEAAGGLAVAFNANEYALPYATVGLASTFLSDLQAVLETWSRGGREAVAELVRQREKAGGNGDRNHLHWLPGRRDIDDVVRIHKRLRHLVREEAGKLG